MLDFILITLIAASMVILCCLIAYEIMRQIWEILPSLTMPPRVRVALLIAPIFLSHVIGIWLYATAYFLVENFTNIGAVKAMGKAISFNYHTFLDCLYFSASTYTSLGFGDIVPTHNMRMLAAAEVLNGFVLIAWTASFTYLAMEKFWPLSHNKNKKQV